MLQDMLGSRDVDGHTADRVNGRFSMVGSRSDLGVMVVPWVPILGSAILMIVIMGRMIVLTA